MIQLGAGKLRFEMVVRTTPSTPVIALGVIHAGELGSYRFHLRPCHGEVDLVAINTAPGQRIDPGVKVIVQEAVNLWILVENQLHCIGDLLVNVKGEGALIMSDVVVLRLAPLGFHHIWH